MELQTIDMGRVAYLVNVTRPAGQLFLPKAALALTHRYGFQVGPTPEQLLGDTFTFRMGEFDGAAINDFSIYEDGLIVASKSDTNLLEAFIDDLFKWGGEELGVFVNKMPPHEKHFESHLIVSMDIKTVLPPVFDPFKSLLTHLMKDYGLRPFEFDFGGLSLAPDPTAHVGRKPVPFTLARRAGIPFDAGFFYSTAPLKTRDHLGVLKAIEDAFA